MADIVTSSQRIVVNPAHQTVKVVSATSTPTPSGVSEAPIDGTLYGRQGGLWVPLNFLLKAGDTMTGALTFDDSLFGTHFLHTPNVGGSSTAGRFILQTRSDIPDRLGNSQNALYFRGSGSNPRPDSVIFGQLDNTGVVIKHTGEVQLDKLYVASNVIFGSTYPYLARADNTELRMHLSNSADGSNDYLRFVADTTETVRIVHAGNNLAVGNSLTFDTASGEGIVFDGDNTRIRALINGTSRLTLTDGAVFMTNVWSNETSSGANVNVASNGLIRKSISRRDSKKYILPLDRKKATEMVRSMKPVGFSSKLPLDAGRRFLGFIAEDQYDIDYRLAALDDDQNPDGVDDRATLATLTAALQDAHDKIQVLEEKLEKVSARLEKLGV